MKATAVLSLALSGAYAAAPNSDQNRKCVPPADEVGAVFAMTNAAADNKVIAFSRSAGGNLTQVGDYSTGGHGQGVDFDTQGGLQLDANHRFLYAVSPASDMVTVFSVEGSCLCRVQTIYGGDQPLSITLSADGYAYVLTASPASTGILGFKVDDVDGTLSPLTNKTIPLSNPIGLPGGAFFAPDGRSIVVVNKVDSNFEVFAVGEDGQASPTPMTVISSSGLRPFAATFNNNGSTIYVPESGLPSFKNSALSTYRLNGGSTPSLTAITKSERNEQTAACWVVVTPDEKYAYTSNFVSGSLSSYRLASNGTASLLAGAAALTGEGSQPVDMSLSSDGRYLYALLRGTGAVAGYDIQEDGSLKQVGELVGKGEGLPPMDGASGLAAY